MAKILRRLGQNDEKAIASHLFLRLITFWNQFKPFCEN